MFPPRPPSASINCTLPLLRSEWSGYDPGQLGDARRDGRMRDALPSFTCAWADWKPIDDLRLLGTDLWSLVCVQLRLVREAGEGSVPVVQLSMIE